MLERGEWEEGREEGEKERKEGTEEMGIERTKSRETRERVREIECR